MDMFLLVLLDFVLPLQIRELQYHKLSPPIVTLFSCIASSKADCVLGGVLLISSARIILENIGPLTNLNIYPLVLAS